MNNKRKELKIKYKERKIIGGIYRITNQKNGRFYLNKTNDIQSSSNWFLSCYSTGICTHPRLARDWNHYGKDAFTFEVLEQWEKDEKELAYKFENELKELLEMWSEKLPQENRY